MAVRKDPAIQQTCRDLRICLHQAFKVRDQLSQEAREKDALIQATIIRMEIDVRSIIGYMKNTMRTAVKFAAEQERFLKRTLGE